MFNLSKASGLKGFPTGCSIPIFVISGFSLIFSFSCDLAHDRPFLSKLEVYTCTGPQTGPHTESIPTLAYTAPNKTHDLWGVPIHLPRVFSSHFVFININKSGPYSAKRQGVKQNK